MPKGACGPSSTRSISAAYSGVLSTRIELCDFGVAVHVTPPPASQTSELPTS